MSVPQQPALYAVGEKVRIQGYGTQTFTIQSVEYQQSYESVMYKVYPVAGYSSRVLHYESSILQLDGTKRVPFVSLGPNDPIHQATCDWSTVMVHHMRPEAFLQVDGFFAKALNFEATLERALKLPADSLVRRGLFQMVAKGLTIAELEELAKKTAGQQLIQALLESVRRRLKESQKRAEKLLEEWQAGLEERTLQAVATMDLQEKAAAANKKKNKKKAAHAKAKPTPVPTKQDPETATKTTAASSPASTPATKSKDPTSATPAATSLSATSSPASPPASSPASSPASAPASAPASSPSSASSAPPSPPASPLGFAPHSPSSYSSWSEPTEDPAPSSSDYSSWEEDVSDTAEYWDPADNDSDC